MGYDEELADRVRAALSTRPGVGEKRMFGGLAFLVGGRMAVAVSGQGGLMVRCDPARSAGLVTVGVAPVVMNGRALTGWLLVVPDLLDAEDDLRRWADTGCAAALAVR